MKIKILKSCSGYNFSFKQGDTAEVKEYIGEDLIGCGFAEAVSAEAPPPEDTQNPVKTKRTHRAAAKAALSND